MCAFVCQTILCTGAIGILSICAYVAISTFVVLNLVHGQFFTRSLAQVSFCLVERAQVFSEGKKGTAIESFREKIGGVEPPFAIGRGNCRWPVANMRNLTSGRSSNWSESIWLRNELFPVVSYKANHRQDDLEIIPFTSVNPFFINFYRGFLHDYVIYYNMILSELHDNNPWESLWTHQFMARVLQPAHTKNPWKQRQESSELHSNCQASQCGGYIEKGAHNKRAT